MKVMLHTLASNELSANKHAQSTFQRMSRSTERKRLRAATVQAIQDRYGTDIPVYEAGIIDITYLCSGKKPGDGMYRPRDPSNIGGEIIKGPIDAIVDIGILHDDDYRYVAAVILRLERVKTVEEEGILVCVEPVIAGR